MFGHHSHRHDRTVLLGCHARYLQEPTSQAENMPSIQPHSHRRHRSLTGADRMFPPHKLAELSSASFFQSLDATALNDLLPELDWINLAGGDTLFRAGEPGDAMYVVIAGRFAF